MLNAFGRISTLALLLTLAADSSAQSIQDTRTPSPLLLPEKPTENDLSQVIEILGEASSLAMAVAVPQSESKSAKILQYRKDAALESVVQSQARAGDITGALRSSRSGKQFYGRRDVAIVQARKGLPEDALRTIEDTIPDHILKKELMRAFLKAGERTRAEQIASDDPILLGFLAATQSKNGDPRFKETFAQGIRKAIDRRRGAMQYAIYPLVRIAQYQDLAGDPSMGQATLSLAKKILQENKYIPPGDHVRDVVAIALAEITNAVGEQRTAIVQHVVDEARALLFDLQIGQLLQFSQDLRDRGHTDLAQQVLQQTMIVSENAPRPTDQLDGLTLVAAFLGKSGNKSEALALLERATTIAESLEEPGFLDPAGRELKGLGLLATGTNGGELSRIARIAAEQGVFDFAFVTARKLPDEFGQAKVLATIAGELVKIRDKGELDRQIKSLSSAVEPLLPNPVSLTLLPHKDHTLMALAAVEAAVGDIPRALHLANTVSRSMRRYAYGDILEVLINAVDIGNSDRVLAEMKEEWLLDSYAWKLQRLTRAQSKAGYYKRALDLARSQVSPLLQANALIGTANGLMDWKDVPMIPGLGQSQAHTTREN